MIFRPETIFWHVLGLALLVGITGCSAPDKQLSPADRAREALARGDGVGAEIILRQMLDEGTPQRDVAALMGQAELAQNMLPEARRWLEAGDFSESSRAHGFHMLGRLELADGRLPEAGQAFDRALQTNADDPELWVDIGRLRYRGGEQAQAVEASIQAVKLGPENPSALQFRGQLVRDAYGTQAAIPWLEAALEQDPDDLDLLGDYAATLGEMGEATAMLEISRRMLALDPHSSRAFYLQSVLAARAGKFELARNLLARSGDYGREMPAGMMLSAIIDLESGNYASAAQTLDVLQARQPGNRRVANLLARSLALGGNNRELAHRFSEMAKSPAASPYLATLVGRSYEILGQRKEAAVYLDRAALGRTDRLYLLEIGQSPAEGPSPDFANATDTVALVRQLARAGRGAEAVVAANTLLSRTPGSADAMGLAGDAHLAAGKPGQALAHYEKAALIRQLWPLKRRMLAAQMALGRQSDAMDLLEWELGSNPSNAEAAVLLAGFAANAGDHQKARQLFDHAILLGRRRDPDVLSQRAISAVEAGDADQAASDVLAAYRLQRMNRTATQRLSRILIRLGNRQAQARALSDKAAKLPTVS